jgi:hypothetical protein
MNDRRAGAGWVAFAAIMIMIAGILNIIWGIAAINSSRFFVGSSHYIVSDLTTWGWVALVIGVLELFVSYSISTGGEFGRWAGVVIAGLNAIAVLLSINAYPLWGLCVFAIDLLIIYGLVGYGGDNVAEQGA